MTDLPSFALNAIGQDTEFFLWDPRKQQVIPAHKYYPPRSKALRGDKGLSGDYDWSGTGPIYVFRDGFAVEGNSQPVTCRAWLFQDLQKGLQKSRPSRMPKYVQFTSRPLVEVTEEMLEGAPRDVQRLGCSPTLDAYTGMQKELKVNPKKLPFRTSGAHLHISFKTPHASHYTINKGKHCQVLPPDCHQPIIKLADLLIGLPFSYIFDDALEFKRRSLYGSAGEFRFQEAYGGLEYRVLSSRLYNHPGIFGLFTGIWKYLIPRYTEMWKVWDSGWEPELQEAINTGKGAEKFFPIWDRVAATSGSASFYDLAELTFDSARVWKLLKELNKAGEFPDAGVVQAPFAEAHTGWREYYRGWRLGERLVNPLGEDEGLEDEDA